MRFPVLCVMAGGLAMLLATQLGATQDLSIKKQKATATTMADDNNEQTQDKSKDVWEEQQERRLLVKRAINTVSGYRADPMLPDTRRGGLGSSARSIGDSSIRSAFFSKRRRLQSRARSASAKARSSARSSGRTSARSAARSAARRIHQRSVVPGTSQRRRLSSGARSMSSRRGRRFRNSRRFTGWQPMRLARFTRSASEQSTNENDGAAQNSESLGPTPKALRAGSATSVNTAKSSEELGCECSGKRAAGKPQGRSKLNLKDVEAESSTTEKPEKSEESSQEPKGADESARSQLPDGSKKTLDRVRDKISEFAKNVKEGASDLKDKNSSREPHGNIIESQGEEGNSGGGLSELRAGSDTSSGSVGGATMNGDIQVDIEQDKTSARKGLLDTPENLVNNAQDELKKVTKTAKQNLPVAGGIADEIINGINGGKIVGMVTGVAKDAVGAARKSSPQGPVEIVDKVSDEPEELAAKETLKEGVDGANGANDALVNLKENKRPSESVRAEADGEPERQRTLIGQKLEGPLNKVGNIVDKSSVEGALRKTSGTAEKILNSKLGQSEPPRERPGAKGGKDRSRAVARDNETLKTAPKASISLGAGNSAAKGTPESMLSGSLVRSGGKEDEAKKDEEIESTKLNPQLPQGTKRGSGFLDAVGAKIKEVKQGVKQEVKAAIGSDGKPEVLSELQKERDEREDEQPPTQEQQQEQSNEEEQEGQRPEAEQEDQQQAWVKSEQEEDEDNSERSRPPSESEYQSEGVGAKLDAAIEKAPKALGQKVEGSFDPAIKQQSELREQQQQGPPQRQNQLQVGAALTPPKRPLPFVAPQMQLQQPLKSTKGLDYKYLLSKPPPEMYESPRIDRLPAKCASKLYDLTGALNEILTLIERLGQRVLADSSIDYLTRDSLSRKLAMVRAFAEEARMQANLGQLRRLNESGRATGVETMRLANWPVANKLDKNLRPLALQMRKIYIAYRKACKGVASS